MAKKKSSLDLTPNPTDLESLLVRFETYASQVIRTDKVLAIDPGTANIGFAYVDATKTVTSKIDLPKIAQISLKVRYVEDVIAHWVDAYAPTLIVKEGPAHFSAFGVADAGRVQYAIERLAFECDIPLVTVTPMSMRSYMGVAGKGKSKSDTRLAVFKKYGFEADSEDEIDAFALAKTGIAIVDGSYEIKKPKPKVKKKGGLT